LGQGLIGSVQPIFTELAQISQLDKGKRFFNLPKWMHRLFLLARVNYDKQA
jgi:hypothetical protein